MSWGAIFDFDGVVVDSADHHWLCWKKTAEEYGASLTHEQFLAGFGVKNERFITEICGWTFDPHEVARRKEAIFQEHIKTAKIGLIPGVEQFLEDLTSRSIPCAIASSSILKNIELVLHNTPIEGYFSQIVSGEDVSAGKPNPDCFLKAAKKLQLPPEKTVVFEDALLGIEAAKRAGCFAVALTTTFTKEKFIELPHKPEMVVESFLDININAIDSWFH